MSAVEQIRSFRIRRKKKSAVWWNCRRKPIAEGPMSAERRIDLINRTIALIVDNGDKMVDALMADFGNRSPEGTLATDVGGTLGALNMPRPMSANG